MKNNIRSQVDADLSKVTWTMHDQYAVMNRIREGGNEPVKKKVSFVAVLAAAILAIGATVAVAEMLGFNIFELFGKTDERYKEIAPYTVLEQTSEVSVSTVKLGTTVASINSAYYDGQSLMVGYSIQNDSCVEEIMPDEALFAKMTKVEELPFLAPSTDEEANLFRKWNQFVSDGKPIGISIYSISPSDHTITDEGVDIPPCMEDVRKGEDGIEYSIREYETPLPEELQNLDHLTLNIRLAQSARWYYFDGMNCYTYYEWQELEPMKATVWNTNAEIKTFAGSGQYEGIEYKASVRASAVNAQLEMRLDGESLPQLPDHDHWYELQLTDETGKELRIQEYDDREYGKILVRYEGTGKIPSELTLRIFVDHEGEFDKDAAIREAQPVVLTPQK